MQTKSTPETDKEQGGKKDLCKPKNLTVGPKRNEGVAKMANVWNMLETVVIDVLLSLNFAAILY
jgi:hypothetical protein